MKRSQRLNPIIELAAKETEQALVKVGQANTVWAQNKQQLDDLHHYKGEYLSRLRDGNQLTMSAQKVLELRAFLAQLDQAISAQEQVVNQSKVVLEQQQEAWRQVRSKEEAMNSLSSRYKKEEIQLELKREQNESDERNTMQWLRKSK